MNLLIKGLHFLAKKMEHNQGIDYAPRSNNWGYNLCFQGDNGLKGKVDCFQANYCRADK